MVKALMRKRLKLTKNQKGMTLIELMAVVVIIGILAAVAGTAVMNSFDKSKTNSDKASVRIIQDAVDRYRMDKNAIPTLTQLQGDGYLREVPAPATAGKAFNITSAGVVELGNATTTNSGN